MGTLRSTSREPVGHSYNGITLGDPVEIDGDPSTAEWDHERLPTGTVELVDGELVVTPDVSDIVAPEPVPVDQPVGN